MSDPTAPEPRSCCRTHHGEDCKDKAFAYRKANGESRCGCGIPRPEEILCHVPPSPPPPEAPESGPMHEDGLYRYLYGTDDCIVLTVRKHDSSVAYINGPEVLAAFTALARRLQEAEKELAWRREPSFCSVCLGRPLPSGRPCICGGKGTEQAEMHGLRVECFELTERLPATEARLAEAEDKVEELEAQVVCLRADLEQAEADAVRREKEAYDRGYADA